MDYIILLSVSTKAQLSYGKVLICANQSQKCLKNFVLGDDHQRFKPMERSDVSS